MGVIENPKICWLEGPKGIEIKSKWYTRWEKGYKIKKEPERNQREITLRWLEELAEILSVSPQSFYLSGSLAIDVLTDNFETHTNTDLAMLNQGPIISALLDSARKKGFYPFSRLSSSLGGNKLHMFHPLTEKEITLGQKIRNLELARIVDDCLPSSFEPQNHIKLYLHSQEGSGLVCPEDKGKLVYPSHLFKGQPYQTKEKRIYVINPEYLSLKLNNIDSKNEKHKMNRKRLEALLS